MQKKKKQTKIKFNLFKKIKTYFEKKSNTIFDMFETHMNLSYSAIKLFDLMNNQLCDGKVEESIIKNIISLERKDDEVVNEINYEIYKGRLLPYTSEDWFNLAQDIDDLTDFTELAARLINTSKLTIPNPMKQNLRGMSKEMLNTVKHLSDAVVFMKHDLTKARDMALKIDGHREKVREFEFILLTQLFKMKINAVEIMRLKDLITVIAKIADKAESISDRVAAMAVKYSF
ncbi:MAG: DUF47 family protein [Candidatus Nanoarchaeia archaeon]|nr:DUF47 family protein [Candidatus Nanoarchaeia archaeon]